MVSSLHFRLNTLLLVLLVVMAGAIIALLASRAYGGPLDPPAAPTSTMKTLDEIPGSWSRRLDSTNGNLGGGFVPAGCDSSRFKCVLVTGECQFCVVDFPAVLDEETGLVWQLVPSGPQTNLSYADFVCLGMNAGDRLGWRLPTIAELTSVVDSATYAPTAGSPFTGMTNGERFWSTTVVPGSPTSLHTMNVGQGVGSQLTSAQGGAAWCVRGPGN